MPENQLQLSPAEHTQFDKQFWSSQGMKEEFLWIPEEYSEETSPYSYNKVCNWYGNSNKVIYVPINFNLIDKISDLLITNIHYRGII